VKGCMLGLMAEPKKDKAAQSMAAKRWGKTTPEERSEVARKLNEARWGKKKKRKVRVESVRTDGV
jgi:hypothetical protein